jgi:hypothetical protein
MTPGDDFGMMREVMERRFSRLVKEHDESPNATTMATTPMPRTQAVRCRPGRICC